MVDFDHVTARLEQEKPCLLREVLDLQVLGQLDKIGAVTGGAQRRAEFATEPDARMAAVQQTGTHDVTRLANARLVAAQLTGHVRTVPPTRQRALLADISTSKRTLDVTTEQVAFEAAWRTWLAADALAVVSAH